MVRGSGDEPRTSGKPEYDGTLKDWPSAKIMIKSYLHQKQKWLVTKNGVAKKQPVAEKQPSQTAAKKQLFQTPAPMQAPATNSTGSWKILMQDTTAMMSGRNGTTILGPLGAAEMLNMINTGGVDRDTSLISFSPLGFDTSFWEPFTDEKELQIYRSLQSGADTTPMRGPETYPAPTLSMAPSETEEASDASKDRSEADDTDAYHLLVGCISVKGVTGKALVQQIDEKFSGMESGHELFAWLDSRAKASGENVNGLVDADDAKADLLAFKIPEGELTKEVMVLHGGMFKTLYLKQPPERHGMKQDITMAWIDKLPAEPFNELVTQLEAINLLNKGPSVFDDFDEANKMLCALYSNWCKKNRLVVITDASKDTTYAGGDRAALFTQRGGGGKMGWMSCYRCWKSGEHLSYECDKAPSRCVTCGLDTVKTGISCGGEYDPLKCMIKGYEPPRKVPEAYMEKMRNWATKNNVKFGKPSEAGASSDVKVEPDKALVAYNPEQVSWGLVNGQWVGSQD